MSDKIYVGNGKTKTTQYGDLLSVTLDLDKLIAEYNNHGWVAQTGGRKIKVTVLKKKEIGEYGDSHYLSLDTWHPDTYNKPKQITITEGVVSNAPEIGPEDDIPF